MPVERCEMHGTDARALIKSTTDAIIEPVLRLACYDRAINTYGAQITTFLINRYSSAGTKRA